MSQKLRVLILSGPTREYIDPVRYLSNASSGRQGIALATEALERGWEVELVQGPVSLEPPAGATVFDVVTAQEMLDKAVERHAYCDVVIGAAAVADFRPVAFSTRKQKREAGKRQLELEPTADILATLGRKKGLRLHVGFALETDTPFENALRKLLTKNLDWIVLNSPAAIDAERGTYDILGRNGEQFRLGELSKRELAARLFTHIESTSDRLRIQR